MDHHTWTKRTYKAKNGLEVCDVVLWQIHQQEFMAPENLLQGSAELSLAARDGDAHGGPPYGELSLYSRVGMI
jgi:hypothetical protein